MGKVLAVCTSAVRGVQKEDRGAALFVANHGLDSEGYLYKAISFNFEMSIVMAGSKPVFSLYVRQLYPSRARGAAACVAEPRALSVARRPEDSYHMGLAEFGTARAVLCGRGRERRS